MAIDYTRRTPRTASPPAEPTAAPVDSAAPAVVAPTPGKIDYTRRGRSTPSAPSKPDVPVAPALSRPVAAPPVHRPRRDRPTSGTSLGPIRSRAERTEVNLSTSTLVQSARSLDQHTTAMRAAIDSYRSSLAGHITLLVGGMPDCSDAIRRIRDADSRLRATMTERFGAKMNSLYNSSGGPLPPVEVWLSAVEDLLGQLATQRVPLTSGGRDRDWQRFSSQFQALVCHTQTLISDLHKSTFQEAERILKSAPSDGKPHGTVALDTFPAAHVSTSQLPAALAKVSPGIGPLRLSLGGYAVATEVELELVSGDGASRSHHNLSVTPAMCHAVIDLDRSGGFRTDMPILAERVLLSLLVSLPADQLVIRVFDPLKLGDSAQFLYGLGDVADRVIGDKVKTTDREIDELLQETEEHITRVTQKYLQNEHSTLTEYNIAAKMVTEPYRVLLLYGFPAGFQRQGHVDRDRLERLAKIIDGGPRSGVFTVIVSEDAVFTDGGPDASTLQGSIGRLPCFGHGRVLDRQALEHLVGLSPSDMAVRPPTTTTASGLGVVAASTFASLRPGEFELRWAVGPVGADEQKSRREILLRRAVDGFSSSTGTVIRPGWVAGLSSDPNTADPYQPATWWKKTSERAVTADIGQLGASKIATLTFDSEDGGVGALIGGRPGSGKSMLVHAIIMSLVQQYPPDEIELYLVDFKEGVEFKRYADHQLPHARAVAIGAEREFGIAVLEGMVAEIDRRGTLFKGSGTSVTKLGDYRALPGVSTMARQIAIIDEFQKLFEVDDRLAQRASHLIERILREGRAFGLHIILASQTIQGMQGLDRHVLSLVPTRIALRMGAGDSELVLGEGNSAAKEITRSGEGIINTKQGHPDANERFQTTLWHDRPGESDEAGTDVDDVLAAVRSLADTCGHTATPRVYSGDESAVLATADLTPGHLPIGVPVSLAPPMSYTLRREGGANLLVVTESLGPVVGAIVALARDGQRVRIVDFLVGEDEWSTVRDALGTCDNVVFSGRRDLESVVDDVASTVSERLEFEDYKNPAEHLVLLGLHRARDLDPDNDYDDQSANARLTRILRDGPEVGVHVIAWADRAGIISRRVGHSSLREFGLRLVGNCSPEDSQTLLDNSSGSTLKPCQAVFDDHERGVAARVLAYGLPSAPEIAALMR